MHLRLLPCHGNPTVPDGLWCYKYIYTLPSSLLVYFYSAPLVWFYSALDIVYWSCDPKALILTSSMPSE
jgi:hypothetical protein